MKDLKFLFFDNPIELRNFSILFTFLCILILINAVNMFDGVNLQLGLYSLFLFLVFFFKSYSILFLVLILLGKALEKTPIKINIAKRIAEQWSNKG